MNRFTGIWTVSFVCLSIATAAHANTYTVTGKYDLIVGELPSGDAVYQHKLIDADGTVWTLAVDEHAEMPKPGSQVEITGSLHGRGGSLLTPHNTTELHTPEPRNKSLVAAAGPPLRWAIVLVHNDGQTPQLNGAEALERANVVNAQFQAMSQGMRSYAGLVDPGAPADIFGDPASQAIVETPSVGTFGWCSISTLRQAFDNAYPSVNASEYDRIMYVMRAGGDCSYYKDGRSWGSFSGGWTVIKSTGTKIMVHELGHNEGFRHGGGYNNFASANCELHHDNCCDVPTVGHAQCDPAAIWTYYDRFCPMGTGGDQFASHFKLLAGWLSPANVVEHDFNQGPAFYQLVAIEDNVTDTQVLRVPYEGNQSIQLELRMLEHCMDSSWCDAEPVVDVHISPVGYSNYLQNLQVGTLSAGEAYTDVYLDGGAGAEITVCDINTASRTATIAVQRPQPFLRADVDGNGLHTISDAIQIFAYLQGNSIPQQPMDVLDVNDDGVVDIADPIYLLQYLFKDGPEPPAPFHAPGLDGVSDFLPGASACS